MRAVQLMAVTLALALPLGETWRSWGAGRPLIAVADDWVAAALLLASAWLLRRPSPVRLRAATAIWGVVAGGLLSSFVTKLTRTAGPDGLGNLPAPVLTGLVGLAFAFALAALATCILSPEKERP